MRITSFSIKKWIMCKKWGLLFTLGLLLIVQMRQNQIIFEMYALFLLGVKFGLKVLQIWSFLRPWWLFHTWKTSVVGVIMVITCCFLDVDLCLFMLFNSDCCRLTLIESDWCWLILINSDWCWLLLIDADYRHEICQILHQQIFHNSEIYPKKNVLRDILDPK